jgi:hypothetical protein
MNEKAEALLKKRIRDWWKDDEVSKDELIGVLLELLDRIEQLEAAAAEDVVNATIESQGEMK